MSHDFLLKLIAGDVTAEEGEMLWHIGLRLLWRAASVAFVTFALGWWSALGVQGFARAGEVDAKISVAIAPLNNSVTKLQKSVEGLAEAARQQTLQLLRVTIVEAKLKQCKSSRAETADLYRRQVLDAQSRYFELTGTNYPAPACADL